MRIDAQLEQEAQEVAAGLRAHADDFSGVHVVRVDPSIDVDDQGDPFISPSIVLSDPDDPDQGWPYDPVTEMRGALLRQGRQAEHEMWVYTHLLSVSDESAA